MNLKTFTENLLEIIELEKEKKAIEMLSNAYIQKAKIKNQILQIELENIDPESRSSIEKQQMKIAKNNEKYKQLLMELELIRASINALETFLKVYEKSKQEEVI